SLVKKNPPMQSGDFLSEHLFLVEKIAKSKLHIVGGRDARVVAESRCRQTGTVGSQLESRSYVSTGNQAVLVGGYQDRAIVQRLHSAPAAVEQVAKVEDIDAELEGI